MEEEVRQFFGDARNSVSDYPQYQYWVVDAAAPMDGPLRWRRRLHWHTPLMMRHWR
jgi:hypothetical protein